MKKIKSTLFCFLLISVLFVSSCKEEGPYRAEITVTDTTGNPVAGAKVVLSCYTGTSKPCDNAGGIGIDKSIQTSDGAGKTMHEFKLPAVLKIEATKGNLIGKDFIKWEVDNKGNYERNAQKTVTLK